MSDNHANNTQLDPDVENEVLAEEPKNILLGLVSQLCKGMDLHKVTLPTFVLEPRSMCERITDFLCHPDTIANTGQKSDPIDRFVDVVRFFLSGWHIKPKGVKKPYNPVLGEFFRCVWTIPDGSTSVYVCEQVSHHPPRSAWYYANPSHNLVIQGDIRPKSKYLGNSAATIMQGQTRIFFLNRPGEVYYMSLPNIYARGILFGTMYMEIGDVATVRCPELDLAAEIEFKTKGIFKGKYNEISGKIRRESTGEHLFSLSGFWSHIINIQKSGFPSTIFSSSKADLLIDVTELPIVPKSTNPETQQEEFESRKLWSKVTKALTSGNIDLATEEKTKIEENQRELCHIRSEKWIPRFFVYDEVIDEYEFLIPNSQLNGPNPVQLLTQTIFSAPSNPIHSKFWVSNSQNNDILPSPVEDNQMSNVDRRVKKIDVSRDRQGTQEPMILSPISPNN